MLDNNETIETAFGMSISDSHSALQNTVAENYAALSETLRVAADYVVANRVDVATRSLRAVAASSGVSPSSFSRLARGLGFSDYEELRDMARAEIQQRSHPFTDRARKLRSIGGHNLIHDQAKACIENISALADGTDSVQLAAAVECLASARKVTIVGALGSSFFADYFAYLASWVRDDWHVTGRNGTTLAGSMARLTAEDVVVVISIAPYAQRAVRAAQHSKAKGAKVIALTDDHAFPGLQFADFGFFHNTDSPQFFSSYAAVLAMIETIIGMLVARSGPEVESQISSHLEQSRLFERSGAFE